MEPWGMGNSIYPTISGGGLETKNANYLGGIECGT